MKPDWLGWAGIVTTVASITLVYFEQSNVIAGLLIVITIVLFISAAYVKYALSLPTYIVSSIDVVLTIHDAQGNQASIMKTYNMICNFNNQDRIAHRNIAAEGDITNFRSDGRVINANEITTVLGEYHLNLRLPSPKNKGDKFEHSISYDLTNSFPSNIEGLAFEPDYKTKTVNLIVNLPNDKKCVRTFAYYLEGSGRISMCDPAISTEFTKITKTINKPKMGYEYCLVWEW